MQTTKHFRQINIHIFGFNRQPHLSLQTSVRKIAIFMLSHWNLEKQAKKTSVIKLHEADISEISSHGKQLTENLIDSALPSRASSSIAGPPLLLKSRPSHFAVLSYASPIASSMVVPSCMY